MKAIRVTQIGGPEVLEYVDVETPKAGPGVYANTMSVAAPGRLPDGTGSERTLTPILPERELTEREAAPKGTEK